MPDYTSISGKQLGQQYLQVLSLFLQNDLEGSQKLRDEISDSASALSQQGGEEAEIFSLYEEFYDLAGSIIDKIESWTMKFETGFYLIDGILKQMLLAQHRNRKPYFITVQEMGEASQRAFEWKGSRKISFNRLLIELACFFAGESKQIPKTIAESLRELSSREIHSPELRKALDLDIAIPQGTLRRPKNFRVEAEKYLFEIKALTELFAKASSLQLSVRDGDSSLTEAVWQVLQEDGYTRSIQSLSPLLRQLYWFFSGKYPRPLKGSPTPLSVLRERPDLIDDAIFATEFSSLGQALKDYLLKAYPEAMEQAASDPDTPRLELSVLAELDLNGYHTELSSLTTVAEYLTRDCPREKAEGIVNQVKRFGFATVMSSSMESSDESLYQQLLEISIQRVMQEPQRLRTGRSSLVDALIMLKALAVMLTTIAKALDVPCMLNFAPDFRSIDARLAALDEKTRRLLTLLDVKDTAERDFILKELRPLRSDDFSPLEKQRRALRNKARHAVERRSLAVITDSLNELLISLMNYGEENQNA